MDSKPTTKLCIEMEMETEEVSTPERLEEDVQLLKEWMSKEPHLPKIEDDDWLRMTLYHNKFRLEKTKTKIDNYFSFRNKYPEVLKNRDPLGSDIAQIRTALDTCMADKLTNDGGRIMFLRFQPDPSAYDIMAHLKIFFMLVDLFYYDKHTYAAGVADLQHLTYRHVLKGFPGIKIVINVFFNAYANRFRGLHVINLPYGLEPVCNKIKSLLPENLAQKLYFHSSPAELCKMVDENIICSDLGGKGPSLAEYDDYFEVDPIHRETFQKIMVTESATVLSSCLRIKVEEYTTRLLEERRDWFLAQDNICTNEALRRKPQDQPEEMHGSFRKLDVD